MKECAGAFCCVVPQLQQHVTSTQLLHCCFFFLIVKTECTFGGNLRVCENKHILMLTTGPRGATHHY